MQGTVKWFSNSKGYGFIGRQDGADVFVHYSGIAGAGYRTLEERDSVQFEIVQGPKGLQANNVTKIGIYPNTSNHVPTRRHERRPPSSLPIIRSGPRILS